MTCSRTHLVLSFDVTVVFRWRRAHDLNDIFQEAFHASARNIGKFRPIENGSFRGWLRTLTRNKVSDHFRKAQREPQPKGGTEVFHFLQQFPVAENHQSTLSPDVGLNSTSKPANPANHEAQLERSLLRNAFANIQAHFTEQTWQAFCMVVIDGRETSDVAADLSMRPGTARVAKSVY
jgi:RNA polymerase sigma-70 factor (ECF subfamily)